MNILEILSFSFCSERTKALATSLKLTAHDSEIDVSHRFVLSLVVNWQSFEFNFYGETDLAVNEDFIPLPPPDTAVVQCNDVESEWRKPQYEMKDWLEHFLTVLHYPLINELKFKNDCNRFHVYSIADALNGYSSLLLSIEETEGRTRIAARQALELFPNSKGLRMGSNPFDEPLSIHKVFNRNYNAIWVNFPVTLEDLLTINSSEINLPNISEQVLNRFLKLWTRGANPRLEHLLISTEELKDKESILKNLKYTRINKQRMFLPFNPYSTRQIFSGGYDIRRHDGTVATIRLGEDEYDCKVEMFVWFK